VSTPNTRTEVFRGRVINVGVEQVTLPNGVHTELEIIRHPGGAAIVAINDANEVCVLRQYRHAAGGWLWELPAGKIDNQEPPLETAHRELAEEAGVSATEWTSLGAMISSPGVFTEVVHLFLATDLTEVDAVPEFDEVLEPHWVSFPEAVQRALLPADAPLAIWDAKSALGLLRASAVFNGREGRVAAVPETGRR
jgi:8-oxo-dGTP pyrophosphatase MutT (NUDIX family)